MHQPSSGGGGNGGAHSSSDDFFDQMLSTLPTAWADLGASGKSPWDSAGSAAAGDMLDESSLLASRLRQHQIGAGEKPVMLQLSDLHHSHLMPSPAAAGGDSAGGAGFVPLPLFVDRTREEMEGAFNSPGAAGDDMLYNGYPLHGAAGQPPAFTGQGGGGMNGQSYGGATASSGGTAASSGGAGNGGGSAPPRQQRVRARRGQATDPHSIAERLRRERIAERMKALQELVPNANKTDKASMLDEIIDYVKFLQLQVKVLSMSRLGGAAAVAPLVANMSSEGGSSGSANGGSSSNNGNGGGDGTLRVTEVQVAKLMEEDMGSAMQYLQGKGLCLMPISLASAISSATCSTPRPSLSSLAAAVAGNGRSASPPTGIPGLANGDSSSKR